MCEAIRNRCDNDIKCENEANCPFKTQIDIKNKEYLTYYYKLNRHIYIPSFNIINDLNDYLYSN